jgi:hypothetical protein
MQMSHFVVALAWSLIAVNAVAQSPTSSGTAQIKINGLDFSVAGEYPTMLCGSAYVMGTGMAYQVQAGDYRITIASETRSSGVVPLNQKDNTVNVVATISGKGRNLARGPRNGGKLTISSDYKKADASLELRTVGANTTATLNATFECK